MRASQAAKRSVLACLLALGLQACGSLPGATEAGTVGNAPSTMGEWLGKAGEKALELTGLKKPEVPENALPDRRVAWRLHASQSLNTLPDGRPLSLLVRIYRLRAPDGFLQAPPEAFGDPAREKDAMGDDLVSVREIQLVPGQRHESIDKLPRDIANVGIVALFHHPASGRWRQAFASSDVELSGIDIGLHACAMTVHTGRAIGASGERSRSAAVACF